jgi:uroporphyrinogen decarboxylase
MTGRQRVLAALNHEQPDRVPMDLGSTRDSSMVLGGYRELKEHLGIAGEDRIISRMMQAVEFDQAVLDALEIDTQGVFPPGPDAGGDVELEADAYRDEWGVTRVKPPGALYYDQRQAPLAGEISIADIRNHRWPDPDDPGRIRGLKQHVADLRARSDRALVLKVPSGFIHVSQYLRGFEDWFMDIAADRPLAEALFDAVLEVNMAVAERILREVGDMVDVVMTADDLGFQNGLMVSTEAYRELIKPRHARYFELCHRLSPAPLLLHTCGAVGEIVEDLIEIGVDVLHPVQVAATGMDPADLQHRFGGRIAFWGGIDTQHVLPHGSVEDVRREVERMIDTLGRDGGYVLGAVHNIQPDVPCENVVAMYEHARQYWPRS